MSDLTGGKAIVTVEAPMTEATGKAILAKLDAISESLMAIMISAMGVEEQARVDRHD